MLGLGINYGQDEDEKKENERQKETAEGRRRERGRRLPRIDPAEKSLEEFGSADAYNRPSLPSNKTHASISLSKKYRFRMMRDVYFGDESLVLKILLKTGAACHFNDS